MPHNTIVVSRERERAREIRRTEIMAFENFNSIHIVPYLARTILSLSLFLHYMLTFAATTTVALAKRNVIIFYVLSHTHTHACCIAAPYPAQSHTHTIMAVSWWCIENRTQILLHYKTTTARIFMKHTKLPL
jgi:hypothetical protein